MRKFLLALVALVGLSTAVAMGNYAMTQGAGTTFGSVTSGGVHYVQMFLCDLTTPAQCGSVSAAGAVKVDGSAVTQPVSGTVTASQGTAANLNATVVGTGTFAVQAAPTSAPAWAINTLGSTTSGQSGQLALGAVTTAAPTYTTAQSNALSLTTGGALRVDASGSTQPVSGTVAVTQSTSPWIVAGGGIAGSAATGVVTVQGIASMTPLFMASATAPVSTMNSASANSGVNVANAAVFDDASPTAITENSFGFLRMSANRNLYGTIRDAAGNERGANVDASNRLTTAPTMVSGSVASGAYASGSIASGALASGAGADGWDVTQGAKADAACSTATGTCSTIALLKYLNTAAGLPIPLNVNTVSTAQTGLTPGASASSQTGTIIAANTDASSVAGVALGVPANFGTSPGAVKAGSVNAAVIPQNAAATQTAAVASNLVLKASAGGLLGVTMSIGATSGWLMIFDATSAPADGAVTPKFCRYVKSDGTGGATSLSWGNLPVTFATGITAVFSTTGCFTKTASSTAFFSGQVQ